MAFKKGNKQGGRLPADREREFFKTLDSVGIPLAVEHCILVLQGKHPKMAKMRDSANYIRIQNDAAKILMSKAPQRLEGPGEDGALVFQWKE